jgi:hypothetical protein
MHKSRRTNKNVCVHIPISVQCWYEAYDALIPRLFDESVSTITVIPRLKSDPAKEFFG